VLWGSAALTSRGFQERLCRFWTLMVVPTLVQTQFQGTRIENHAGVLVRHSIR
jgi:hypothetical protein